MFELTGVTLKKNVKPGKCDAMRCKEAPAYATPAVGNGSGLINPAIALCERHYTAHAHAAQGAVLPFYTAEPLTAPPVATVPAINSMVQSQVAATLPAPTIAQEIATQQDPVASANQVQADVLRETQEIAETLPDVRAFVIESPDDVPFLLGLIKDAREQRKALEARRKSATGPLNASLKMINSWFRPATDHLTEVESIFKSKLSEYKIAQDAERARLVAEADAARAAAIEQNTMAAASVAAADAAQAGGNFAAAEAHRAAAETYAASGTMAPVKDLLTAAGDAGVTLQGGSHFRESWQFAITDAALLPREYMTPDLQKIGAVVRAAKGAVVIPGVQVSSTQTPVAR